MKLSTICLIGKDWNHELAFLRGVLRSADSQSCVLEPRGMVLYSAVVGRGGVSTRWSRNIFKYWVSCNTFRCCRDTLPLLPPIENHKKMGHTWEFMCQPRLWGYVWQERRQFFRAWCYLFLVRNKHRKAIVSMWIQLSALIPSDWISYPDVRHLPLIPYMLWRLFLEKVLQEWLWTGTR